MLSFLADENFDNRILDGLLLRKPDIDVVRAQDVGLDGRKDPVVLDWAAQQGRIVLTHDVSTITAFAYQRIRSGQRMPGVFEIGQKEASGAIIEDILLIDACSTEGEWENRISYLPL
jgi:predicted nuclease of predicted toxin-antitoxin system